MNSSRQGEIVELDLQQIVESASKLAQSLNDVQEDWGTGSAVGQAKSDMWRRFGELFGGVPVCAKKYKQDLIESVSGDDQCRRYQPCNFVRWPAPGVGSTAL